MKKTLLVGLFAFGMLGFSFAQSLSITSADETVGVNSTSANDYFGRIIVKNNDTAVVDVYCKRQFFGSGWCAFDSAYFCWDLCYPNSINQSIGGVSLNPGQDTNAFSGHVYSSTNGSSCVDSIRYTFYNGSDIADSISIVIKYEASATFDVEENDLAFDNIYPNPVSQILFIELADQNTRGLTVDLYNLLGSKIRSVDVTSNRIELNVADLHAGIYMCTISKNGTAIETRKIVVRH